MPNVFITSIICLTQARVLLVIKHCHAQRWTVSSLLLLLRILWFHETRCTLCNSPFKGHCGDSCRKMKKTFWLNQKRNLPLSLFLLSCLLCPFLFSYSCHFIGLFHYLFFLPMPHFSLFTFQSLTATLSLTFLYLLISYSLKLISLPALPFPFSVCLSQTHCSMRLILLAPNAPCSTSSS